MNFDAKSQAALTSTVGAAIFYPAECREPVKCHQRENGNKCARKG